MKERSLYFREPSADAMVRAVLNGTKTQHRVPVKTPVLAGPPELDWLYPNVEPSRQSYGYWLRSGVACISPFGGPGDRLRIKECWQLKNWSAKECAQAGCRDAIKHPSDKMEEHYERMYGFPTRAIYRASYNNAIGSPGPWKPSSQMPRWASRILRPVKRVWIEQLQDIRCCDIRAEGVSCPEHDFPGGMCVSKCSSLYARFAGIWDSTYASKGFGWSENPGVWACEFESER